LERTSLKEGYAGFDVGIMHHYETLELVREGKLEEKKRM
jgi:hypothetical protein